MINPAGDAQKTGRTIGNTFERSIALQFAEKLQNQLETIEQKEVQVILTRGPGDIIREQHNANFANRLPADLFLSIHFFRETQTKPRIFLYTFDYKDHIIAHPDRLAFYSYDQAYVLAKEKTDMYAHIIQNTLNKYEKRFTTLGIFSLPCKPLIGIKVPAIMIEVGIKNSNDWLSFVQPIVNSIAPLIN